MKKYFYLFALMAASLACMPQTFGQENCPGDAEVEWLKKVLEEADARDQAAVKTDGAILIVEKTASPAAYQAVGDQIAYTILVRNAGTLEIRELLIEDPLTGLSDSVAELQPGDSLVYTDTYTITQADMDFASVVNIARVSGLDPDNNEVFAEGISHIRTTLRPGIDIRKSANPRSFSAAGELITYTIELENTGNVSVHFINVYDPLIGFSGYIPALAPGDTQTFTGTYVVTQEDVDAGFIMNEVFYSGGSYYCFFRVDGSAQATITLGHSMELILDKSASHDVFSAAGEEIVYTITLENPGSVAITDITLEDPLTGMMETIPELDLEEIVMFTENYIVTQADLDAGHIRNLATASGFGPGASPVSASDEVTVFADQQPGLFVSKSPGQAFYSAAGEQISFEIIVTNTGNVTISDLLITDPLTGLEGTAESISPGQSLTFIETYLVTQEDLDQGSVLNQVIVSGMDPAGNPVSEDAEASVHADQHPELSLEKTSDPGYFSVAGDQIDYTIVVTNSGNVTLSEVRLEDPLTGLDIMIGILAPGQSGSFTETYTITSGDVASGQVMNVASVSGLDPNQEEVHASAEVVVEKASVELQLSKHAETDEVNVGEQVTYTMVVSNNNQVPAINVVVSDELPAGVSFVSASDGGTYDAQSNTVTWMMGDLAADDSFTLSLVVQVNLDVAHGTVITNFAVANNDNADFPAESNPAIVTVIARADLMILKGADVGSAYNGDQITYTLTVTNMGPSTAQNVVVSDLLPPQVSFVSASEGGAYNAENHSVSWSMATMASQASMTLTIVVEVNMDVAAGTAITNFASVGSDTEDPDMGNNEASVTVTGSGPRADVQVVKSVDGGVILAGSNFSYTITVTNNGPSTATNIVVVDILPAQASFVSAGQNGSYNAGAGSVTWNIASLAAGQSQNFTITLYVPSDVRGGTMMVNEVSANSDVHDPDPQNNTYIDQTPVTTPELFIPDVFSPNNDGVNDRWIIRGLDRYPNNKVVIINRWGNRVFEAAPYNNDWNGTNQFSPTVGGNELPIGTYYYILDLGNDDVRRGFIYLTR